jgi:hypothetical protein
MTRNTTMISIFLCLAAVWLGAQQQTGDGGYVIAGTTESYTHGTADFDLLLYKVNGAGIKQWRKNYGGAMLEFITTR